MHNPEAFGIKVGIEGAINSTVTPLSYINSKGLPSPREDLMMLLVSLFLPQVAILSGPLAVGSLPFSLRFAALKPYGLGYSALSAFSVFGVQACYSRMVMQGHVVDS